MNGHTTSCRVRATSYATSSSYDLWTQVYSRSLPHTMNSFSMPDARQAPFWYMTGAFRIAISVIVLLTHTTQRWRYHKGRGGWNPTYAFVNIFSLYFILDGAWYLFWGSWRIHLLNAPEGPAVLLTGVASMAPYLVVLLYGRQKLFKVMARRFEKKRRGLDGALIAELMNDTAIECGAEWWIHHGNNLLDEYPDPVDHRANWTRAVVVEVQRTEYAINLNVEQKKLDVGNTNGNDGGSAPPQQGGGGWFVSSVRRLRSIEGTRSRRNVLGGGVFAVPTHFLRLPIRLPRRRPHGNGFPCPTHLSKTPWIFSTRHTTSFALWMVDT